MIANCLKEKDCSGHLTVQEAKDTLSSAAFMIRDLDKDAVIVPAQDCWRCKKTDQTIIVIRKDWHTFQWDYSGTVQDMFPYLSAKDREKLITGMCDKCFDDLDVD